MIKFFNTCLKISWILGFTAIILACQSQTQKPTPNKNKFSDPVIVQIYDHQDRRNVKELTAFFNDDEATYRAEAALALSSVQDPRSLPILAHLLYDSSSKVRKAAAYALGQLYDSAASDHLAQALANEESPIVRKELLEALGKVITQPQVSLFYDQVAETEKEKEGLSWGIYRAGLRNVHDAVITSLAISFLGREHSYDTRLGAAHFLSRTKDIDLTGYDEPIIKAACEDKAADVRMAAAAALHKTGSSKALTIFTDHILMDPDYRVRVNGIKALSSYNYPAIRTAVFKALQDENINVAVAAAEVIERHVQYEDAGFLKKKALTHRNLRVRAMLLGAALKLVPNKEALRAVILKQYENTVNPYYRAALLQALGNDLQASPILLRETFNAKEAVIRTAGINALVQLRKEKGFPEALEHEFEGIFKRAIETYDIALVTVAADLLSTPELKFKQAFAGTDFLYQAKHKLSNPKGIEALQALNRTIAHFEGNNQPSETTIPYNNPINWEIVKTIDRDQHVKITTVRGEILLKLLVEEAPGTVANFVSLCRRGYFDGKTFHRTVPNFVIQGGGNRGDGYGSEDFSIRSEFANRRYRTGAVGMASAGKDTEGTQWFITHAPTPHLDGRYTIFAQVIDGMEVVHHIEVGDQIVSVELL